MSKTATWGEYLLVGINASMWGLTGALIYGSSLTRAPPWYYAPIGIVLSTIATVLVVWRLRK